MRVSPQWSPRSSATASEIEPTRLRIERQCWHRVAAVAKPIDSGQRGVGFWVEFHVIDGQWGVTIASIDDELPTRPSLQSTSQPHGKWPHS